MFMYIITSEINNIITCTHTIHRSKGCHCCNFS